MKKIILFTVCLLTLSFGAVNAQSPLIKAGMNFNSHRDVDIKSLGTSWKAKTGFHIGIGYQIEGLLDDHLAIQPELLYVHQGSTLTIANIEIGDLNTSTLLLPINIQIPLVSFEAVRPYIFAAPYLGFLIGVGGDYMDRKDFSSKDLERFDYGLGLGAGVEISKIQISAKYSWGFGKPFDGIDNDEWVLNKSTLKGFELSAALKF